MTPDEKIDELYERINDLHSKLYWYEDIEKIVRKMLLKSHMPIGEVEDIFYFLNMPDNRLDYILEDKDIEKELFKVLEMI